MYKTTTFCRYLEAWSFGRKYHFKKFGTVALGVAELYYKKHTVALGVTESNYKNRSIALGATESNYKN